MPATRALTAVVQMQGWALPVLRKIKGSTIGVEDLWVALQNSPTAEALAVCEASLGKSGHVTGFVQELLGYVAQQFHKALAISLVVSKSFLIC